MESSFNWWKIAVIAIVAAFLFGLGFYLGRKKDPDVIIKTEVKYVELPPIRDSIPYPVPYEVIKPIDTANIIKAVIRDGLYSELFPEKIVSDTIYITKEDTATIIKDWATERRYQETLFDSDTLGRLSVDATIKYNRMSNLGYIFTPIQKQTETTVRTTRKFLPYLGAGFDTNSAIIGQGGMFIHQDAGFALQYRYDTQNKQNAVGGLFLYMF